ncbi:hypothetical protein EYC84_007337 [Monilinia fructicola]|uniref:tRNA (adenine(58)-N(1))-methyltransferase catalytic subunit TRM61 n=1 Tax=Monilinia fructicola TaxID=38448 RepID=A0A5M9JG82_MONFR|nr:hypothetical protein EYC84_007337 [Monilinia fructicola]
MSTIQRTIFSGIKRVNPYKPLCLLYSRRSFTQRLVRENDIVFCSSLRQIEMLYLLCQSHSSLAIPSSVVAGGRRALFRIYEPTLGEYCDNAPRMVTPIYSSDASLIVSLLDINYTAVPSSQSETVQEEESLEPSRPLQESLVPEDGENSESAMSPGESETEENDTFEPDVSLENETRRVTDIPKESDHMEHPELSKVSDALEPIEELTDTETFKESDSVKHDERERLEIFEAGTGHGSLTLHLARAIHGANSRAPSIPKFHKTKGKVNADDDIHRFGGKLSNKNQKRMELYDEWRSQRRAVIHTLDSDERHSRHAQRTIRNYRHGAYFPHIDFHVGSIHDYLSKRLEETNDVFLDHAILDIPGVQNEMEIVGKCIKPDGRLITWCPSITQHIKCLETVKGKKLPFVLDRVLELGSQLSTGGREWEVRSVKPRALIKAEKKKMQEKLAQYEIDETAAAVDAFFAKISKKAKGGSSAEVKNESELSKEDVKTSASESESESVPIQTGTGEEGDSIDTSGWEMICRPKVGDRIAGGGFVGVWKKMDLNV